MKTIYTKVSEDVNEVLILRKSQRKFRNIGLAIDEIVREYVKLMDEEQE